jgi:hypothetical protein
VPVSHRAGTSWMMSFIRGMASPTKSIGNNFAMASTMRKAAECHPGRELNGVVACIYYIRNLVKRV